LSYKRRGSPDGDGDGQGEGEGDGDGDGEGEGEGEGEGGKSADVVLAPPGLWMRTQPRTTTCARR
jgi:hypothetical protein